MSHLNLFEMRTRYSIAVSILNKFRHWLLGRIDEQISKEKEIINESLVLGDKEKFLDSVLYSLHGYGNKERAAAVQISEVIDSALEFISPESEKKAEVFDSLKRTLKEDNAKNIRETDRKNSLNLITKSIHIIGSSDQMKPTRTISPKIL